MIINNLNIVRIALKPPEANSPLIIDPDAVLAGAIAPQHLKTVAG